MKHVSNSEKIDDIISLEGAELGSSYIMGAPFANHFQEAVSRQSPMIYKKMIAVFAEIPAIGKDSTNQVQNFKYRGIDAVYNTLHGLFAKHGIFMTAEVVNKHREERTNKNGTIMAYTCITMRYRFWAEDGSCIATEAHGEGADSGDKSSNKAMAVAHKYALLQVFCVPTQDMADPDTESHELMPRVPDPKMKSLQDEYKATYNDIMSVQSVDDLKNIAAQASALMEELKANRPTAAESLSQAIQDREIQLNQAIIKGA